MKAPDGSKATSKPRKAQTKPQKRDTPQEFDSGSSAKRSKQSDPFSSGDDDDDDDKEAGDSASPSAKSKIKRELD